MASCLEEPSGDADPASIGTVLVYLAPERWDGAKVYKQPLSTRLSQTPRRKGNDRFPGTFLSYFTLAYISLVRTLSYYPATSEMAMRSSRCPGGLTVFDSAS